MTGPRTPWQERLWAKVQPNDAGCWIWLGTMKATGYGMFTGPTTDHSTTRTNGVHRWAYVAAKGPIPDGLVIDHLCNVRNCVNPDHLEAVTDAENNRRRSERQTHCKRGHEYTAETTYRKSDGSRSCRPCNAARDHARHLARKRVAA